MAKIRTAIQILQNEGPLSLASQTARQYLRHPPAVSYSRRLLGRTLHQKLIVYSTLGYWPQIRQPRSFNEKILHRQLFEEDELLTIAHNKLTAREYVAERIGDEILPDLFHVTDDPETIPFESLPDAYVVKSNIGSGDVLIVDGNGRPTVAAIKDQCEEWLSKDYYTELVVDSGNYCYNLPEPKILVEERLNGNMCGVPLDYKFYVFHGQVEYIHVDFDRYGDRSMRFFDREWNPQNFRKGDYPLGPAISKPARYEEMVNIAETLGEEFKFIRVDLYHPNDERIVFGELTIGPGSGQSPFTPREKDFEFGSLW